MDLKVMPKSYKGHKFILCIIDEIMNYVITLSMLCLCYVRLSVVDGSKWLSKHLYPPSQSTFHSQPAQCLTSMCQHR